MAKKKPSPKKGTPKKTQKKSTPKKGQGVSGEIQSKAATPQKGNMASPRVPRSPAGPPPPSLNQRLDAVQNSLLNLLDRNDDRVTVDQAEQLQNNLPDPPRTPRKTRSRSRSKSRTPRGRQHGGEGSSSRRSLVYTSDSSSTSDDSFDSDCSSCERELEVRRKKSRARSRRRKEKSRRRELAKKSTRKCKRYSSSSSSSPSPSPKRRDRQRPQVGKGKKGKSDKGKQGGAPTQETLDAHPQAPALAWSDSEEEEAAEKRERERLEAKAMTEKCRRENHELRRQLAEEKKKNQQTPDPLPPAAKVTVGVAEQISDEDRELDSFEKALKMAQEAFDQKAEKAAPINPAYARIVDGALRRRPNEEKMKLIMSRHLCPENVPNTAVPKTNTEVWDLMNRGAQVADNAVQRVQLMQVHALSALLEIINSIGHDQGGATEDHLATMTDATRLITMSFSSLTQVRKELVRNSMGFPIAKFCTWETAVGEEQLFDELGKKLKDKDDVQYKLKRKSKFRKFKRNSGGRFRRGYRPNYNRNNYNRGGKKDWKKKKFQKRRDE